MIAVLALGYCYCYCFNVNTVSKAAVWENIFTDDPEKEKENFATHGEFVSW